MAPAFTSLSVSPFTVLYLRPEIASGFYNFPVASRIDARTNESEGSTSASPSPPLFPGVPAEEAAFFLPDGHVVVGIRKRLVASGFSILEERMVQFTKSQLRRLYFSGLHPDGDEASRAAFLDHFTRGPTLALLLSLDAGIDANAAVVALQTLVGPENPSVARQHSLETGLSADQWPLRALSGLNEDFPGVYASATLDCAVRERHDLFRPTVDPTLDSAVVVLLPSFVAAVATAKAQLLTAFNHHGVVVTNSIQKTSLSANDIATIASAELDAATDAVAHESFRSHLTNATANDITIILRVVGFSLGATLRQIVGPATTADAKRFFPESIRAQLPTPLHVLKSSDHSATCLETGVFLTFHTPTIQSLAPEDEQITTTFAIIKPNAARDHTTVAAILHALLAFGFCIDQQRRLQLTSAQAAAFYAEHTHKPFFQRLVAFMTSGKIVALQLSRKLAIPMWRALMGPTDATVARMTHPWTLRARFGVDGTQNATHGSDAAVSARRELRFFFGATLANAPVGSDRVHTVDVVKGVLEKVVVRGLDALLQRHQQDNEWTGPLDACRWLGEWLLRESERSSNGDDATTDGAKQITKTSAVRTPRMVVDATPAARTPWSGDTHRTVAIVVDASVAAATKQQVKQFVHDRADQWEYAFVDVASVPPTQTVRQHVTDVGRRRVVLFDWDPLTLGEWTPHSGASAITTIATLTIDPSVHRQPDPLVQHVTFEIPTSLVDASPLRPLFRNVLDPQVVLLMASDDDTGCGRPQWQSTAQYAGFAWLLFDALVAHEIKRENDPLGAFTQWQRTNATLAPALVLDALKRAIADPAAIGLAAAAHKFLLVGFPSISLDTSALEQTIGSVHNVIRVDGHSHGQDRAWGRRFEKRGALVHCESPSVVDAVLKRVLMPHVIVVLSVNADVDGVKRVAAQQGGLWIDVDALPSASTQSVDATIATLRSLLLRMSVTHERVVIHNFPRTTEEATAFLRNLSMPRTVLVVGQSPPTLKPVLDFLQHEAPQAIQSVVSSVASPPLLCGLLSPKRLTLAVGDCSPLDASILRTTLAAFGVALIDARDADPQDTEATLDTIARVVAPRCLLLASGSAHVDLIRTLQSRLGDAFTQLLVLKQRTAQPPPVRRIEDDDYDSEDEREREKVRQREARAISPELTRLVDVVRPSTASTSVRVRVVSYLHVRQAHAEVIAVMQPKVVGIRGHALTFYQDAVRAVCRLHHLPFVDLRNSNDSTLARLRAVVAACASGVVVVDGFPSASTEAPYAAQQIRALEENHSATMPLLVRFRASLGLMLENDPTLSRNAFEDAQDEIEGEHANNVDAAFASRRLRDVSCDRGLQDSQDAFADVLTSSGLVGHSFS